MTKQLPNTAEIEKQFNAFWCENGRVATYVMSELNQFITLVPGKFDRGSKAAQTRIGRGLIVLTKSGFERADTFNGKIGTSTCLSTQQAIEAFAQVSPDESFMDTVKTAVSELFER
jgi:hypothetical protein